MRVCSRWGWQNLDPPVQKTYGDVRNRVSYSLRLRQSGGMLLARRGNPPLNYIEYQKPLTFFKLQN